LLGFTVEPHNPCRLRPRAAAAVEPCPLRVAVIDGGAIRLRIRFILMGKDRRLPRPPPSTWSRLLRVSRPRAEGYFSSSGARPICCTHPGARQSFGAPSCRRRDIIPAVGGSVSVWT